MEKKINLLAYNRDRNSKRANFTKKSQYNFISSANELPLISYKNLWLLAEKLSADCYRQEKSSEEIMRDFIVGIEKMRGDYVN